MKSLIFVLVFAASFDVLSQTLPSREEMYDFSKQFIFGTDSVELLLLKNSDQWGFYKDTSVFLHDTTYFSNDDLAFFRVQLKEMNHFKWNQNRLQNVKTISRLKLKWIFRNYQKGWKRFCKKYPKRCYRSATMPIFNANKTYCIFYQSVQCGGLSGQGSTNIYKLEKGKWIYVDSYGMWVS
ncbi:MAG: hypothetical protein K0S23_3132 [Fluviicola sp.]|jgi:hypothetical protein|uniref:hypothetical protein n=1 Tax=Fluviicola sp. TaxID=1917219 RepID=UPI00261BFF91|nr:hypothetical protein [Fluviicola sp.]MDF3028825.1 hypothetical protein [Fluviicola sp.]